MDVGKFSPFLFGNSSLAMGNAKWGWLALSSASFNENDRKADESHAWQLRGFLNSAQSTGHKKKMAIIFLNWGMGNFWLMSNVKRTLHSAMFPMTTITDFVKHENYYQNGCPCNCFASS